MAKSELTGTGILLRLLSALVLVVVTWNPSGWSYSHWAFSGNVPFGAVHALVGVGLLCLWVLYGRAAQASLGMLGVFLLVLLFGTLVWVLAEWGIVDLTSTSAWSWVTLLVAGLILGIGLCWSHLRRRLTGQVDVDELEG